MARWILSIIIHAPLVALRDRSPVRARDARRDIVTRSMVERWLSLRKRVASCPEPRVSDKLVIDLWGATISAEGIYAIGAPMIIIVVWRLFR
jgi:hypothetical protein